MTRMHIQLAGHNLTLCGVFAKEFVVLGTVYEIREKPLCQNCLKIALREYGREH
jgi:hypothetical protein